MSAGEFSFTRNLVVACWQNMSLMTILSQWPAGTLLVLVHQTCIYIGEGSCHYQYYIPCCTIYGTNVCNLTMLMTWWYDPYTFFNEDNDPLPSP